MEILGIDLFLQQPADIMYFDMAVLHLKRKKVRNMRNSAEKISAIVMHETVDALKQYQELLKLSNVGEVIDRIVLQFSSNDPAVATTLILEQILLITQQQPEERLSQTMFEIIGSFAKVLIAEGMNTDDLISKVTDVIQNANENWKPYPNDYQIIYLLTNLGFKRTAKYFKHLVDALGLVQAQKASIEGVWIHVAHSQASKVRYAVQRAITGACRQHKSNWEKLFGDVDYSGITVDEFLSISLYWLKHNEFCISGDGDSAKTFIRAVRKDDKRMV